MSEEIRKAFDAARADVEAWVASATDPDEILRRHADAVDDILRSAFVRSLGEGARAGVALVALGGYGRGELTPGSDLDLLLLHRGWDHGDIAELNRALMYPLWDAGRELGDRVREPDDVFRALGRVDEAAAVVDARLLAGDENLFNELQTAVTRRLERGRSSFFKQLVQASSERHARFGHAGHLLEPNVRDSAGGLRDLHTLWWASKLLGGAEGIAGLVALGMLSELDGGLVQAARTFLLAVRVRLHLLTGRHQDQLYLLEQDEIAQQMGYADQAHPRGDAFMQELYGHARNVDAVTSAFWERVTRRKPRRVWRSTGSSAVGDGCVLQDGRLEVVAVTDPRNDPAAWLRVFRRSIRHGAPLSRSSLNRLHESVEGAELRWTPEAREIFLEILESGAAGVRVLESMDEAGFLVALVPEWEGIRCLPQRDLYHRFTVDMHLFAALSELAASRTTDEPILREAWARVGDADALFVGALLHDVGKGRGGDHSDLGVALATRAAQRMGLGTGQIADIEFLVREHLTLAKLAVQRDLNDQRTIDEASASAGNARRLAMLYVLTRADSVATGPEAWSSFRAMLVRELYSKTFADLEGEGGVAAMSPSEPSVLSEPLALGEVRTSVRTVDEAYEFVLVASDRPGLFATVCGALALRGIDIHDAEIYTRDDGIAVEVFRVVGSHGAVPEERWARVESDVRSALADELDLDDALARKSSQARRRRLPHGKRGPARVVVSNDASETHTVIEVHAEDRLGLLRQITKALYDAGCDLSLAKVATYGTDVVDVFYVQAVGGTKIADTDHLAVIEQKLRSALGSTRSD